MVNRTVCIEKKQLEIEEKGVRVKLTIVDTPGYNDAVNAENRLVRPFADSAGSAAPWLWACPLFT